MDDPTKTTPAEPVTEPVKPTEPTKPAEPATPTEPTKPAEPATPTEPTKPAAPTKPVEPDYKAQAADYAAKAINAEARSALSALGVPAAKLGMAVKLAELGGIDINDKDASDKIAAAAQKVLELVPEFKGGAGTGATLPTSRNPKALDDFQRGYMGTK